MIRESDQKYSSEKTSTNTVNSIYKKNEFKENSVILDYGAGKYDSNKNFIENLGKNITFLRYDKYNRSEEENIKSIEYCMQNPPDYIICSNVLNVIYEDEIIMEIVKNICFLSDEHTQVIIEIYDGDRSGIGRETRAGYQRNKNIKEYIPFFEGLFKVEKKKGYLYCSKRGELYV